MTENKEIRLTKQLSLDKINQEIANNFHWLNPRQKKQLKDLLIDTWNAGVKFNKITKTQIVVEQNGERT